MLSSDQTEKIKKQIISQINSNFPENKREESIAQIESMNSEEFEQFLIQNNIIQDGGNSECIFCSILEGKVPTNKFAESEHAIATLDINPISKAHSLVIPKIHSKEASKETFQLAEIIKQRIEKIFKPKKIEIIPTTLFEHEILNILPIYKNETIKSKRQKMELKELQKIQKSLIEFESEGKKQTKEKEKKEEKRTISDKTHWLPRRIP